MSDKHAKWVERNQITMEALRIAARPDCKPTDWDRDARHWIVTLRRVGFGHCEPLVTFFSQGSGHAKAPSAVDVLGCLLLDASGAGGSFEHWCDQTGYDSDSRKAERIYDRCRAIEAEVREFLGDAYGDAVEAFADY